MDQSGWRNPEITAPVDLQNMRTMIDELDEAIAGLLARRLTLSCRIGKLKSAAGISVKDEDRERTVIDNVKATATSPAIAQALAKIYASVIDESCALQVDEVEEGDSDLAQNCIYFPNVLIIGMGLIGGALARQIKRVMPSTTIAVSDTTSVVQQALEQGVADVEAKDLPKAVAKASLILLCAGPQENARLLEEIAPVTKRRQVVMDVTSTKQSICSLAEKLRMKAAFVGGHPLFGSHKTGFAASAELCVENERFCLIPAKKHSELTLLRLSKWLTQLGMKVVRTEASQHDEIVAGTSHLVQLAAIAIGCTLAGDRSDDELAQALQLSGPALASIARLMDSSPDLWLSIIRSNQPAIVRALAGLVSELQRLQDAVAGGNDAAIRECFEQAKRVNRLLPAK